MNPICTILFFTVALRIAYCLAFPKVLIFLLLFNHQLWCSQTHDSKSILPHDVHVIIIVTMMAITRVSNPVGVKRVLNSYCSGVMYFRLYNNAFNFDLCFIVRLKCWLSVFSKTNTRANVFVLFECISMMVFYLISILATNLSPQHGVSLLFTHSGVG